jgi:hypothetical protein
MLPDEVDISPHIALKYENKRFVHLEDVFSRGSFNKHMWVAKLYSKVVYTQGFSWRRTDKLKLEFSNISYTFPNGP